MSLLEQLKIIAKKTTKIHILEAKDEIVEAYRLGYRTEDIATALKADRGIDAAVSTIRMSMLRLIKSGQIVIDKDTIEENYEDPEKDQSNQYVPENETVAPQAENDVSQNENIVQQDNVQPEEEEVYIIEDENLAVQQN